MGLLRRRRLSNARTYVIAESKVRSEAPAHRVHVESSRARASARARQRIGMCAIVFLAAFTALGARLSYVSLGNAQVGPALASGAPAGQGERPEILDRNGAILATNLPMTALEVAGREVWDAKETATKLAGVFPEINAEVLQLKLENGRYVEVRDKLTPAQEDAVFALGLPGVRFSDRARRYYPHEDLAAHVIGHTEPGKGGVMGLEKLLENDGRHKPVYGALASSLDIRAQQIVEEELAAAMEEFSAVAGWGGVMDASTGEIIALASLPDFDPNEPGAAAADSRRNRASYDRYELGSAFKAITAAAALDAKAASEASQYDARAGLKVADRWIKDFHGENRVLSFSEVVQHSSNIGAARMAADLGPARQKKYLKALGLFESLDIELAENRSPELPWQWGPVEAATIAYGHGISVTPLHLLAAFGPIVNGGDYHTPTFVKVEKPAKLSPAKPRKVFSRETSLTMRRVLRRVITDGTASGAEAVGYYPIGKTATADKPAAGGYSRNSRIASFVGAFPGYAPRYVVLISLDEPQATKETWGFTTAGWNAAPVFARVVERLAPTLGVMPVDDETALAGFYPDDARFELTERNTSPLKESAGGAR